MSVLKILCLYLLTILFFSSCSEEKYENSDIEKSRKLCASGFYYDDLEDYHFKGKIPIIDLASGEHIITDKKSGWSEKNEGYGLYFYTYRDPKLLIDYFTKRFQNKPIITEHIYGYPYPDIEDWKYYEWTPPLGNNNHRYTLHARKYYAGSETYFPYYEFLFQPYFKGKPEINDSSDPDSKVWYDILNKAIDSIYKKSPMLEYDKSKLGGTFEYQTNPLNWDEIYEHFNPVKYKEFYQIYFELEIDTNGNVSHFRNHYFLDESPEIYLLDSLVASKLRYPILKYRNKSINYQTIFCFEFNPKKNKKELALHLINENDTVYTEVNEGLIELEFRNSHGTDFCFSQIGMDSVFIWKKTEKEWKLIHEESIASNRLDQYYNTNISVEDFNSDGYFDFIVNIGPPFDGSGSRYVQLYLFDPLMEKFVFIPEFTEYDLNDLIPAKKSGKNLLYVYTSGGNYGLAQKYYYEWIGLKPKLLEYATAIIEEKEGEPIKYIVTYYRKPGNKLIQQWEKKVLYNGNDETPFTNLIFPDSLIY